MSDDNLTRISVAQLLKREGQTLEDICIESMSEGQAPALCSEGCYVETDGECVHGNPSILVEEGMI